MSDGIADKGVGAPESTAPEAQAGASTMDTTKRSVAFEKAQDASAEETKAKPAARVPKPVEVVSVPQTPINVATPANGTPRPELNIPLEKIDTEKPESEPDVLTGVLEPLPTPTASVPNSDSASEPIVDKPVTPNGDSKPAEMTGALQTGQDDQKSEASETATGEKRKLEEDPAANAADEASAEKQETDDSERADKKAKVDTNGGAPGRGRPGRPKKDKKDNKNASPAVGKTARKTRSQGPVET